MTGLRQVPPPTTGSAEIRLFDLAPEVFEDLCLALVREQPGIQSADKHGRRGQPDNAVDIVGRRANGRIDLFQCKRYASYTGNHLKSHVCEFKNDHKEWRDRGDIDRYVLIVASPTDDASIHRELEAAETWFRGQGMKIELWSSGTVADKLGDHPHLVRRFFHEYWEDKLCKRLDAERATAKLEECGDCMGAADFHAALACAREALALAVSCGDQAIELRARRSVIRNLDHIVVTGSYSSESAQQKLVDEMEDHIQALDAVAGADVCIVAIERALLARLQKDPRQAIEFARIAHRESGDDADTKAEAILIELQALWQLERPEEGLARAEDVTAFLEMGGEDGIRLPLAATWLRTLCRARRAEASDVDAFVSSVRDLVKRDSKSAPYSIMLLGEVASEFARCSELLGMRTLCLEVLDIAIIADEPWRAGSASLDIASASGALDRKDDARRYLGEAERWFEITRQRGIDDATYRTRWIAGMAKTLMAKGNIITRWARNDGNPPELLREASHTFSQALAHADKHGGELPGDADLFVGECHFRLASLALDLGWHGEASAHFNQARSPSRMANRRFRERFGERATLGEAQALTFGGKVGEARALLTDMLESPTLDKDIRRTAEANLAWLEENVVPVTDWYSSDAAMQLRDRVGPEGLQTVVADQMRPLVEWLTILPPDIERNACSELIDVWGRGGFARVATAIRAYPGRAITVSATSTDEIARWARVFCPLYDTVVVTWKGPLLPDLAIVPMPDNLGPPGQFGGQGYMRTSSELDNVDKFHAAIGWANFLPKKVSTFLCTKALPLIRSGRLVVLPGPLVGCTQRAIGWTDNLLVDNALGGVVTVAGLDVNERSLERSGRLLDLATVRIPYVDGISLADLDKVLEQTSNWLSPLRRMLRASISGAPLRQERWEQLEPCFDDIHDACRQLDERWRTLAASGAATDWRVEAATSAFSVGEQDDDEVGEDSMTDFLRATTARSPEIGPWVPFWRLARAGGKIDWSRQLDNPSTPPDDHAKMQGFRNDVTQGWLYPGDGGPGMAAARR